MTKTFRTALYVTSALAFGAASLSAHAQGNGPGGMMGGNGKWMGNGLRLRLGNGRIRRDRHACAGFGHRRYCRTRSPSPQSLIAPARHSPPQEVRDERGRNYIFLGCLVRVGLYRAGARRRGQRKIRRQRVDRASVLLRLRRYRPQDPHDLERQRRIRGLQRASAAGGGEVSPYQGSPRCLADDAPFDVGKRASVHEGGAAVGARIRSGKKPIRGEPIRASGVGIPLCILSRLPGHFSLGYPMRDRQGASASISQPSRNASTTAPHSPAWQRTPRTPTRCASKAVRASSSTRGVRSFTEISGSVCWTQTFKKFYARRAATKRAGVDAPLLAGLRRRHYDAVRPHASLDAQATCTRGLCAGIIRGAGHAGVTASSKLAFRLDHPMQAGQGSERQSKEPMRLSIWMGIFIGSTIGGMIPWLWGDSILSYSSVLLSAVGAIVGLWIQFKASV